MSLKEKERKKFKMERMKIMYKYIVAFALFIAPSIMNASDTDNEKSRKIEKAYPISSTTYVEIENKYGDIEIEIWDKDSIRFDIEIIAHSDKEEDLDEMLDLIKVDMKANTSYVLVATNWIDEINAFKKGMMKFNQKVASKKRYEVKYKVRMPDGIDLSLNNQFGNIFLPSYTGKLEIDISYGDLRAHNLENVKRLTSKSGKVKIKELNYGRVNLSSSKSFHIEKCIELELESSSSEISIDQINTLSLISSHDDVSIENVKVLTGSFSMSDVVVNSIATKMQTAFKYGSIQVKSIDPNSERIKIDASKTDITLNYSTFFNADVDIFISEKNSFSYSESYSEEITESDSDGVYHFKGKIHNGGGTQIYLNCKNGYIQLETK